MKRLSLAELKTLSAGNVTYNLEAIKGGVASDCHAASPGMDLAKAQNAQRNGIVYLIATIGDFIYNLW